MIDIVFPDNEDCPGGGFIFRPGPRGGISQNVECVGCGSRFNVTRWDHRMTDGRRHKMPIVWAQRIDKSGAWREDMFPKILQ